MGRILPLFFLLLCGCLPTFAQINPYGKLHVNVHVPKGLVLKGVKVSASVNSLEYLPDTIIKNKAVFSKLYQGTYVLEASAENFETVYDTVRVEGDVTRHKDLRLTHREIVLPTIKVKGKTRAVIYRGDTIQFNPEAVNKLQNDMAREILEQMPGVEINGDEIQVHGHRVEHTYVDGKKTFGDNPITAFDHIEANDVVHIQAYEDKDQKNVSDEKRRRGSWAMNIITRSKMVNSHDGKVLASAGKTLTDADVNRHDTRYALGGAFNFFSEDLLYSANLMANNENVSSTSNLRFLQIDKVNPTYSNNNCAGLGLDKSWKERTKGLKRVTVGYQYTRKETESDRMTRDDYLPYDGQEARNYTQENIMKRTEGRHDILAGVTFGLSKNMTLSASVNQQFTKQNDENRTNISDVTGNALSSGLNLYSKNGHGNATNGRISLSHRLDKWNYSVAVNGSRGVNDFGEARLDSVSRQGYAYQVSEHLDIPGANRDYQLGVNASASTSLKSMEQKLRFNYSFNTERETVRQSAWNLLTSALDSVNTYHYINHRQAHRASASFETPLGKTYLTLTAGVKHETIRDDNEFGVGSHDHYSFLTPDCKIGISTRGKNPLCTYSLNYAVSGTSPNIVQLRHRIDNQNPYSLNVGNPLLAPTITHQLFTMDNIPLKHPGQAINLMASVEFLRNSVVSKTNYYDKDTYLPQLDYTTMAHSSVNTYDNADGGLHARFSFCADQPLSGIRSNIHYSLNADFMRMPFWYNEVADKTKTSHAGGFIGFNCNAVPKTRFMVRNSLYYMTSSCRYSSLRGKMLTYGLLATLQTDFYPNFFLKANYEYKLQHDATLQENRRESILNLYIGYKCMAHKRGEISVIAYDLFNSYNNRVVTMTQNYTRQSTQVNYGRYISLNFSWTFRKYKTSPHASLRDVDW